jgi:hypothetical protein
VQRAQFIRQKAGSLVIGSRLARRIEDRLLKPMGWLDQAHMVDEMTAAVTSHVMELLALYRMIGDDCGDPHVDAPISGSPNLRRFL